MTCIDYLFFLSFQCINLSYSSMFCLCFVLHSQNRNKIDDPSLLTAFWPFSLSVYQQITLYLYQLIKIHIVHSQRKLPGTQHKQLAMSLPKAPRICSLLLSNKGKQTTGLKLNFNLFIVRVTSLCVSSSSCRSSRYQRRSPKSLNPSKTMMQPSVTMESIRQQRCAVC